MQLALALAIIDNSALLFKKKTWLFKNQDNQGQMQKHLALK